MPAIVSVDLIEIAVSEGFSPLGTAPNCLCMHTHVRLREGIVGNPSLIRLRKGCPLFDENALATAGRDGGRTPQSFAYEGTSRLMRERTGRLELVRSLTPHGHAPASECPKIPQTSSSHNWE